jgi:2-oxoglutarate dehydrogenase E1 component
MFENFS